MFVFTSVFTSIINKLKEDMYPEDNVSKNICYSFIYALATLDLWED